MLSWQNIEKRCCNCEHYYFAAWDKMEAIGKGIHIPFGGHCNLTKDFKVSSPDFKVPNNCPYHLEFILENSEP